MLCCVVLRSAILCCAVMYTTHHTTPQHITAQYITPKQSTSPASSSPKTRVRPRQPSVIETVSKAQLKKRYLSPKTQISTQTTRLLSASFPFHHPPSFALSLPLPLHASSTSLPYTAPLPPLFLLLLSLPPFSLFPFLSPSRSSSRHGRSHWAPIPLVEAYLALGEPCSGGRFLISMNFLE